MPPYKQACEIRSAGAGAQREAGAVGTIGEGCRDAPHRYNPTAPPAVRYSVIDTAIRPRERLRARLVELVPRRVRASLPSRRNRHVQVFWSALWPGLGQFAARRRAAGLLLAIPPLALLILGIAAIVAPDRLGPPAQLLDPAAIAGLLVIELPLLARRTVAGIDG